MILDRIRSLSVVALIAAAVATVLMLAAMAGAASAAVVSSPPNSAPAVVQVVEPGGWTLEAALVGVLVLLKAMSMVLDYLAPRTKNTWDDSIRDLIKSVIDMAPRQPVPVPQVTSSFANAEISKEVSRGPEYARPDIKPRDPQAGHTIHGMMIGLTLALLTGLAIASVQACATVRPTATRGADAMLTCQEDNLRAAAQDLVPLAKSAILRWLSGDGRAYDTAGIKADAQQIKTDLGRCAFEAAVAILSNPPEIPGGPTLLVVADPGATLRERWPGMRAELGWAK